MSLTVVVVVVVVFFVCLFVNENCIPEALIQIHLTIFMGYRVVPVLFFEMFLQDTLLCSFLHSTRAKAAMVQAATT